MDNIQEIWKSVPWNQNYEVSNQGRLRRLFKGGHIPRRGTITKKGYVVVDMCSKKHKLHRVVAIVFIENPLNLPQVNHKDCNKQNNSASNLEWVTDDENKKHAVINGIKPWHKKKKATLV